jgi:hypothetical protein
MNLTEEENMNTISRQTEGYSDDDADHPNKIQHSHFQLQKLHSMQLYWNQESINPRLILSSDLQKISRKDYFEIHPLCLSHCHSLFSVLHLRIDSLPSFTSSSSSSIDCSLGVLDQSLYFNDYNLGNYIGKCDNTWGIVLRQQSKHDNSNKIAVSFVENQELRKTFTVSIQENDDIILFLTPAFNINSADYDFLSVVGDENITGECHVFLNEEYIDSLEGIPDLSITSYSFGITLSPNTSFSILPQPLRIQHLVETIIEGKKKTALAESFKGDGMSKEERKSSCDGDVKNEELFRCSEEKYEKPTSTALIATSSTSADNRPPVPSFFPEKLSSSQRIVSSLPKSALSSSSSFSLLNNRMMVAESKGNDANLCCICLSAPKTILLMPCKHLCLCEKCGEDNNGKSKDISSIIQYCPMCRLKIKYRMKIFL